MKISIDPEIQATSVPVSWCLSRDELNNLAEKGAVMGTEMNILFLVVSTDTDRSYETRYLVPVKQKMEYINFCTPGKHKIFSTVVWKQREDDNLQEIFLSKNQAWGHYRNNFYDHYDKNVFHYFDRCGFGVHKFEVNVPKEVFAKEPPALEKWWVNWCYENKPKDQCYYRRRRAFAYSIQPPLVLAIFLGLEVFTSVIISALLLFGTRGIGFRKILHPFIEPLCSIWDETKGSIFGKWPILRLLPSIFLGSSVISWTACKIFGFHVLDFQLDLFLEATIMGGMVVGVVGTVSSFILLSYYGVIKAIALIPGAKDRKERKKLMAEAVEKERIKKLREKIEAEYALLICDGNLSADIRSLPSNKRTLHLRYQDLKSRICKSFAR